MRIWAKRALNHLRTSRKLYPAAVRMGLAWSPWRPLRVVAPEVAVGLEVADGGLDGRAEAQFSLDGARRGLYTLSR